MACSVGDWVRSLGWDPLEKGKATHSSILAWRIPWTVESIGSQRVRHDWATFTSLHPSLHISTKALEFASQSLVVIYDCCLICFFEYSELECFSIWLSHCFFTLSFPLAFLSFLAVIITQEYVVCTGGYMCKQESEWKGHLHT